MGPFLEGMLPKSGYDADSVGDVTMSDRPYEVKDVRGDNTHVDVYIGSDQDESIKGTKGNDLIFGADGRDSIDGRGGNDMIVAAKSDTPVTMFGGTGRIQFPANDNVAETNRRTVAA